MSVTIDLTYLKSITRGDQVFEKTLLQGAFKDVDVKVGQLQEAWESADGPGVRQAAHSMVSLCAIAGMPQMEQWARSLDQIFSDRVYHAEQAPLYQEIITGWQSAKPQLETILSSYA